MGVKECGLNKRAAPGFCSWAGGGKEEKLYANGTATHKRVKVCRRRRLNRNPEKKEPGKRLAGQEEKMFSLEGERGGGEMRAGKQQGKTWKK